MDLIHFTVIIMGAVRFGTSYLHMYITELKSQTMLIYDSHASSWICWKLHYLLLQLGTWGTSVFDFILKLNKALAFHTGKRTWFFSCCPVICLWTVNLFALIEITVGSARPVTVRSWHSGTQPEWILQSSKSACQEIGHKGNNCQLNQIAWSKLDKFC